MSDLRTQLRDHYQAQALSPEKTAAILARCHAVAAGVEEPEERKIVPLPAWFGQRGTPFALAAAVAIFAGIAHFWTQRTVPYPALQARVAEFFGGKYDIPMVSQDQAALRAWLLARGAPAGFEVPEKLRPMQAYGCRVLAVRRKEAYLICFWLPTAPGEKRTLLHLLGARRSDFRGEPDSAEPQFTLRDGWTFAAWSEGEIIYTLGSKAPPERLQLYVAALRSQQRFLQKSRARS